MARVKMNTLAVVMGRLAVIILVLAGGFAVPAAADPALWVAKGAGATVYLFGTIHVLPAGDTWMSAEVKAALAASTQLWTEADISDLGDAVSALRHYGLDASVDPVTLLPPAYRDRYRREIAEVGLPPVLFAHARPWLAEILLSEGAMQKARPMELGAEAKLLAYAREHHMGMATFETLDHQIALMADMPPDVQLASLEEQIDEFDQAGAIYQRMLAAWHAGDQDALEKLINQEMRSRSEELWTELILRRNEKFERRIEDMLQGTATAFVAVGAGHLCGSDGVPALLKERGVQVVRLK
jgi:uncharacterized protein YbaP (TraB family)